MAASSNPFQRGSWGWGMFLHQNHAARRENGSSWWGCLCDVCFTSKKSSEREFFVPAGTHLSVKLLTALFVTRKTRSLKHSIARPLLNLYQWITAFRPWLAPKPWTVVLSNNVSNSTRGASPKLSILKSILNLVLENLNIIRSSHWILNILRRYHLSHSFLFHRNYQQLVFYVSGRLKFVLCWSTCNINDHGSRQGDTSQTLAWQRRPEAPGEALSMPHQARCAASPDTAAMIIKTNQYDQ